MKIGDSVTIITGCNDCGEVPAIILEIVDENVFVECVGELPHKATDRNVWVKFKHIKKDD